MPFDVGQSPLHAVMLEGEAFMVEAKKMQNGGIEIVERVDVFGRAHAEFVGESVANARLNTRAGHPAGEAVWIVIASLGPL